MLINVSFTVIELNNEVSFEDMAYKRQLSPEIGDISKITMKHAVGG